MQIWVSVFPFLSFPPCFCFCDTSHARILLILLMIWAHCKRRRWIQAAEETAIRKSGEETTAQIAPLSRNVVVHRSRTLRSLLKSSPVACWPSPFRSLSFQSKQPEPLFHCLQPHRLQPHSSLMTVLRFPSFISRCSTWACAAAASPTKVSQPHSLVLPTPSHISPLYPCGGPTGCPTQRWKSFWRPLPE